MIHEGIRYSCDKCDLEFKNKSALKLYINTIHHNVKFECDKCAYKASKSGLRKHKQTMANKESQ